MSLTTAKRNFEAYLLDPIERYSVAKIPFSFKPKQDHRKELIFQQSLFLQVADEIQAIKPWITYFATIKHFRLMTAKDVGTATFNDLRDKKFATEVAVNAENLRDTVAANLDATTVANLEYLCQLQEVAPLSFTASSTLGAIAASPHHQTVFQAAKGNPPQSGCAMLMMMSLIGTVLLFIVIGIASAVPLSARSGSGPAAAVAAILLLTFFIWGGLAVNSAFTRWQAVTALLSSYNTNVVPVAEILGADPLDWLAHPAKAQAFLADLDSTRQQYEHTYLALS